MKEILLYAMSVAYVFAGIMHFVFPKPYLKMMPKWIPWHHTLVYLSGVCEMIFGFLLIPEVTRPIGAWLIIAMLVAIFPANIQMMLNFRRRKSKYFWLTVLRLPFQPLLIWLAWIYT